MNLPKFYLQIAVLISIEAGLKLIHQGLLHQMQSGKQFDKVFLTKASFYTVMHTHTHIVIFVNGLCHKNSKHFKEVTL